MTPMQSRTNKLTLVLLCCLALAGFAGLDLCRDSGGGNRRPTMQIQPPTAPEARAPVAQGAIPDQTLVEGATETLDVEPYFTDPDGDSLTYTVAVVSGASAVTVAVSGSELTIRGLAAGTAEVRVTATDPGGLTAEQDFTVRVEAVVEIPPPVVSPPVTPPPVTPPPAASPPVAQGIPDQTIVEGIPGTLDVEPYFTDPDSSSLTYSAVSGDPSVVTVAVSGSVVTMSGPLGATTAVVRVTATDPGGLSAYSDFTVDVLVQTQ